jgi:hypothetical protein
MAFRAGTTTKIYIANAAGALQDLSPYADNLSGAQNTAMLEVSTFGTASKVYVPGLIDNGQLSMSGPLDAALWTHLTALETAQQSGGSAAAAFVIGWGGSVATYPRTAGSVYVTSTAVTSSNSGVLTYTASLQVSGAVTNGVF